MPKHRRFSGIIADETGYFAMVTVIGILVVMTILGAALIFSAQQDIVQTQYDDTAQRSFYVAESGINNYLWKMNQNENYYKTTVDPAELDWVEHSGGHYSLKVTETTTSPGAIIESTGRMLQKQGATTATVLRTIKVRIQKRSFVRYLYFTDFETSEGSGNPIWFVSGDVIRGPVHTNDVLNINGDPVFEGKVTTSRTINEAAGSDPVFQQGFEENVPPMEIPSTNQELKTWAQDDGYYYYGETEIELAGSNLVITNSDPQSTGPTGISSLPNNGVVYVDGQALGKFTATNGDVYIEGSFSGKLTIGARNNIYITDDILYDDPTQDMLGLIAENYVHVNHWDRNDIDVAPFNIEINAAVFAINHSFGYEDPGYNGGNNMRGTLTVKGAIVQRFRGSVGSFWSSSGAKASGYTKDYQYDERMLYEQPPHFIEPLNAGFEIVNWDQI